MIRSLVVVVPVVMLVGAAGIFALHNALVLGPVVLLLGLIPLVSLLLAGRRIASAVPDLVFGGLDTGLLALPAIWGGVTFGVVGAVAGTVVGDAITDAVAGFFEGHIAEWLRSRGFPEAREAVMTSLGKMSGCLLGSGLVLSVAWLAGLRLPAA
jgi:hypothetical protein